MASYFQTTIHSKNSKFQKMNGDKLGKLVKGTTSGGKRNLSQSKNIKYLNPMEQLTVKEQSLKEQIKSNEAIIVQKQVPNKKLMNQKQTKGTYTGQSQIFPAIFFKKTTMRQVFKEFQFPQKCKALQPNDQRCSLIFQIVGNLFSEITFYIFNLIIAQNFVSKTYFAFFSDSQNIPFTKCCNSLAYVELQLNGTGKILCNNTNCLHPSLAEFLISYQDSTKLWKDMTYLQQLSEIDRDMKTKISNYIKTGKYRKKKLQSVIDNTSKQVSKIYFSSKEGIKNNQSMHETPFITDIQNKNKSSQVSQTQLQIMQVENEEHSGAQDHESEMLKIQLSYITKKHKNLNQKITRGIIEQGKVFNKKFDIMDKLDEFIEQNNANKTLSKMTFPKLISKFKVREQSKSRAKSRNKSFMY